jgi:type II secretory pathway pseudopilin PulG
MRRRRGFSLVELLVVLSSVTVLLSLTAVLLTRAMRSQAETRHYFESQRHALALSEQFRRDVHAAKSVELDAAALNKNELVRLTLDENGTVAYLRDERGLTRVLTRSDGAIAREEYDLGGAVESTVQRESSPARLVLSVTATGDITLKPDEPPARIREMPAVFQVDAAPGGDRRYARSTAGKEGSP